MQVLTGAGVSILEGVQATLSLSHIGRELTLGVGRPWGCYCVNVQLFKDNEIQFQLDDCLCADSELIVARETFVNALNDYNLEQVEAYVADRCVLAAYLRHSGKKARFELVFLLAIKEAGETIWVGEYFVEKFDPLSWIYDYLTIDTNALVQA